MRTRQRDVFPLPFLPAEDFDSERLQPVLQCGDLRWLVNGIIVILNDLAGIVAPVSLPANRNRPMRLWLAAWESVAGQVCAMLNWMGTAEAAATSLAEIWQGLHGANDAEFPDLRADDVDVLDRSAIFDPLSSLDSTAAAIVSDVSLLFPDGLDGATQFAGVPPLQKQEYGKFVLRALRSRKLVLRSHIVGGGSVFCRSKKDSQRLRLIWHGAEMSTRCRRAPRPPMLLTPEALAAVHSVRPIFLTKRDGKILFDQLRLPDSLVACMGLPPISIRLLKKCGMSALEWQAWKGSLTSGAGRVFPCSNVWAMGFGWSSYVAQSTTHTAVALAGFAPASCLSLDTPPPYGADESFGVATDDVVVLTNVSKRRAETLGGGVDDAFELLGIQRNPLKDESGKLAGTAVGVTLTSGGTRWRAPPGAMWKVWQAVLALCDRALASPKALASVTGSMNWLHLLNRLLLTTLDRTYRDMRVEPFTVPRVLSCVTQRELLCSALLGIFWDRDLKAPSQSWLAMSDASSDFGLGAVVTNLHPYVISHLQTCKHKEHQSLQLGEPHEQPRHREVTWEPVEIDQPMTSFKIIIKTPRPVQEHINIEECLAVVATLRWCLRKAAHFGSRIVVAVDSLSTLGAIAKGRSSSPRLNAQVRKVAALCLVGQLQLHLIYTPSEWNVADHPSRGKPLPLDSVTKAWRQLQRAEKVLKQWQLSESIDGSDTSSAATDDPLHCALFTTSQQ